MANKNSESIVESEKNTGLYGQEVYLESLKPVPSGDADYAGSVAKTDSREIALVRKIDWRLMVCLGTLLKMVHVLCCSVLTNLANPVDHVLPRESCPPYSRS